MAIACGSLYSNHMLTLFRRHLKSCPHTSRDYRRCKCPIHIEGSLACLPEKPHGRWILGQPFSTTGQRARANLPSDPLRFVFVFFDCPAGKGIRLPLERSGDAVHRQPESKPGDSLRSRLPVWQRGKGYYRLILDVGGRCGNTLR